MASSKPVFYIICALLSAMLAAHGASSFSPTVVVSPPGPYFRAPTWTKESYSEAIPIGPVMAMVSDRASRTIAGFGNHLIKIYDSDREEAPIDHIWIPGYNPVLHGLSIAVSEPALELNTTATASNDYNVMGYLAHHGMCEDQNSLVYSGTLYKMTRRPTVFPLPHWYSPNMIQQQQPLALPICRLPLLVRHYGAKTNAKLLCSKDGSRFYFLDSSADVLYIVFSDIVTRDLTSQDDPSGPECASLRVPLGGKLVVDLAIDRERDIVFVSRIDQNILALDGRTGKKLASFSVNNRRPFSIHWDDSIQSLIVSFRSENDLHHTHFDSSIEKPRSTAGQFHDLIAKVDLSGPVSEWHLASTKLQWIQLPYLSFIQGLQPEQEDGKLHVLVQSTREYHQYKPDSQQWAHSEVTGTYWRTYQWTDVIPTDSVSHDEARGPIRSSVASYKQLANVVLQANGTFFIATQNPLLFKSKDEPAKNSTCFLYQYQETENRTTLTRLDRVNASSAGDDASTNTPVEENAVEPAKNEILDAVAESEEKPTEAKVDEDRELNEVEKEIIAEKQDPVQDEQETMPLVPAADPILPPSTETGIDREPSQGTSSENAVEADSQSTILTRSESEPKPELEVESESKIETAPEPKLESKPESESESKIETAPEPELESKPYIETVANVIARANKQNQSISNATLPNSGSDANPKAN